MNRLSLPKTLGKLFAAVLLLLVCLTPVICAVLNNVWAYIGVRALFFLLAGLIAFAFRSKAALSENEPRRKKVLSALLLLAAVSFILHAAGITPHIFYTVTNSLRIDKLPLFWAILWEEFFLGDLYWGLLLSLIILFVRLPALGRGRAVQAG